MVTLLVFQLFYIENYQYLYIFTSLEDIYIDSLINEDTTQEIKALKNVF